MNKQDLSRKEYLSWDEYFIVKLRDKFSFNKKSSFY